jgi:hypothetical protein
MGNRSSKQNVEVDTATKLFSTVIATAMQQCTSTAMVQQSISVSGAQNTVISNNIQNQTYSVTAKCNMSQNQINDLRAKISDDIANAGEQNTQALMSAINDMAGGKRDQSVRTQIDNAVSNTVSTTLIQNITASINQSQTIVANGSNHVEISNNAQKQSAKVVLNAVEDQVQQTTLLQDVKEKVKQKGQQNDDNPIAGIIDAVGNMYEGILKGLGSIFGGPGNAKIILFIICAVIIYVLYKRYVATPSSSYGYQRPMYAAPPPQQQQSMLPE